MWLLALALLADTVHTFSLALSPAESVAVTVTGTGDPVVLVPGLFGSAFGYRAVIPLLTDAGYRAIVVEPLGIGSSARPEHADYSLTAQADRIAAALDRLSDRDATLKAFLAMAERREPERLQPHLAEVRCPVRLLLGTATHEGGVSAEEVAVLAAALPAFVVDSVAGAGHFIYEEQPAVVVEAVRRVRAS